MNFSLSLVLCSPLYISSERWRSLTWSGISVNSAKREIISSALFKSSVAAAMSIGVSFLSSHTAVGSTLTYHENGSNCNKQPNLPKFQEDFSKVFFSAVDRLLQKCPIFADAGAADLITQKLRICSKIKSHQIHWQSLEHVLKLFLRPLGLVVAVHQN